MTKSVSPSIFVLAAVGFFASLLSAQNIAGIAPDDPARRLQSLSLKPIAAEKTEGTTATKFKLDNGTDLSVTTDDRTHKVLFIEADWNGKIAGAQSDFPSLKFGETTLENIRRIAGSNGFGYSTTSMNRSDDKLVAINVFKIEGKPGIAVAFVTTLDVAEFQKKLGGREPTTDDIPKNLKLESLILAREDYLDQIWGNDKAHDPNEKPIKWNSH